MHRRAFLTSLLSLFSLPALAKLPAGQGIGSRRVLIQQSPVAGFQYHSGERVWHRLRTGQRLALTREPDNPYDRNAVRLDWRGHKIGYVPRRENTAVAQMLDRGERLEVRIMRLRQSNNSWEQVYAAIELLT